MDAVGNHERIGIELETVAALVPADDGFLVRGRGRHVPPVLVLEPLRQGARNARRRLEVHVGDTHPDLDVLRAVARDLGIPLDGVGPPPIVDRVEVVLHPLRSWRGRRGRARKRTTRPHCARHGSHASVLEERPPIQSIIL